MLHISSRFAALSLAALFSLPVVARAECPSQAKGPGVRLTVQVLRPSSTPHCKTQAPAAATPQAATPAPAAPPAAAPTSGAAPAPAAEAAPAPAPAPAPAAPQPAGDNTPSAAPRDLPPAPVPAPASAPVPAASPATTPAPAPAPVAAASQKAQRSAPELSVGATVSVKSPRLGTTAGQVSLRIDSQLIPCEVTAWMDNKVTFKVPEFDIPDDRPAVVEVSRADGKVFRKFPVQLLADDAEVVVTR